MMIVVAAVTATAALEVVAVVVVVTEVEVDVVVVVDRNGDGDDENSKSGKCSLYSTFPHHLYPHSAVHSQSIPMLLCGFESRLGLESSGCSMWHFLKLVAGGFLRVLRFPPLLHRFNGSANKIMLK